MPSSAESSTARSDPAYELRPSGKTLFQERLATYGLTLFAVAAAYWVGFYYTWRGHPGLSDDILFRHIFAPGTFLLLGLYTALWLGCRGKPLNDSWLPAIDVAFHVVIGLLYRQILLSHPSPVFVPLEALLAISTVLGLRALLLPSSAARTALAGAGLCLTPLVTLYTDAEHFTTPWMGMRTMGPLFITWASVAIAITSVASAVLYGLRRDVRDARRFGQYTLVERLGEGGMGVVYRAEHALLRRPTAVKLLLPTKRADSLVRFEREVQLMAELTHPNTVAVYDYGRTSDGVFYYAMEYLDGVDLDGLVSIGGPQSEARIIHLLRQICSSLDEAHRRGLIHRDMKPANVFLCRNRSEPDLAKVLDFGLVKEVDGADALSTANAVLGTPLYMAPEAFTTPGAVDARGDVYSVGALAYVLLTGAPVFSGPSAIEVCAQHLHAEPVSPSTRLARPVSPDLEAIVLSCLAKKPEARPQSARALRDMLAACTDANAWQTSDADAWWSSYGERVEAYRRGRIRSGSSAGKTVLVGLRS